MSSDPLRRALIDGGLHALDQATLPILDDGVARGDGAFETIGVWGGRPFRLGDHLARLQASLSAIGLPPADVDLLEREARTLCDGVEDDAALRLYVTASGTRMVTLDRPPARPDAAVLIPQPAPWVRPLGTYGPAGAKTMSYMPNMAATRAAKAAGGDDALLIASEGHVLEGPTFAVCWVVGRMLRAPDAELGIVDSISRRTVLELAVAEGVAVEQGRWGLDALSSASEVLISSSVRDVIAVQRVGDRSFGGPTPVRDRLSAALDAARRAG